MRRKEEAIERRKEEGRKGGRTEGAREEGERRTKEGKKGGRTEGWRRNGHRRREGRRRKLEETEVNFRYFIPGFLAAFAGTLVILILLSFCLCCCWCKRRRSRMQATRVNFDDGMLKDASLLQNQDYDSE